VEDGREVLDPSPSPVRCCKAAMVTERKRRDRDHKGGQVGCAASGPEAIPCQSQGRHGTGAVVPMGEFAFGLYVFPMSLATDPLQLSGKGPRPG
jgi:hypothetical protein